MSNPYAMRRLVVAEVEALTPRFRRIVLAGPDLDGFDVPDEAMGPYLKLVLPPAGDGEVGWPSFDAQGRFSWTHPTRRAVLRTYSVRRLEPGALTLDVALHEAGPGNGWARDARVGDVVHILGPGVALAQDADWFLLAGDLTALPAIARILENLPGEARGRALIEVPHREEIQPLAHPRGVEIEWLRCEPCGRPVRLAEAVTATVVPEGARPYLFCGAEATAARPIRRHARQALRLPPGRINVLNYWKSGLPEGGFDYC